MFIKHFECLVSYSLASPYNLAFIWSSAKRKARARKEKLFFFSSTPTLLARLLCRTHIHNPAILVFLYLNFFLVNKRYVFNFCSFSLGCKIILCFIFIQCTIYPSAKALQRFCFGIYPAPIPFKNRI